MIDKYEVLAEQLPEEFTDTTAKRISGRIGKPNSKLRKTNRVNGKVMRRKYAKGISIRREELWT